MFPASLMYRIYATLSTDREDLALFKSKYLANKAGVQRRIAKENDKISSTSDSKTRLETMHELKKWQRLLKNLNDKMKERFGETGKRLDQEQQDREVVEAALQDRWETNENLTRDEGPGILPITTQDNIVQATLAAIQEKHALYQDRLAKTGVYKTRVGQLFQGQIQAIAKQLAALKKSKLFGKIFSIVKPIIQIITTIITTVLAPVTFGVSLVIGLLVGLAMAGVEFLVQKGITGEMKQAKTKLENCEQFVQDLQRQEDIDDKRAQQRIVAKKRELQNLKEA